MAQYIVEEKVVCTIRVAVEADSIAEALNKAEASPEEGEMEFEYRLDKSTWNVLLDGEYVF